MAKRLTLDSKLLAPPLAIASAWATWLLVWPLGLWACLPLLMWAGAQGRKRGLVAFLATPFVLMPLIASIGGATAWFEGRATLRTVGWATAESANLDPRLRVPVTARIPVDGRDAFKRLANNATIRTLGAINGPMPGSYTGRYPTRAHAWDALAQAPAVGPDDFFWGDRVIPELADGHLPLRAAYAGRTLIIGHPDQLWLIDRSNRHAFATWRRDPPLSHRGAWPDAPLHAPLHAHDPVAELSTVHASPAW